MPNSRDKASTGSPRINRRTTSFLRFALQRLTSGAAPVELRSPSAAPETLTSFPIDDLLEHVDLPHFRVQENRGRHIITCSPRCQSEGPSIISSILRRIYGALRQNC